MVKWYLLLIMLIVSLGLTSAFNFGFNNLHNPKVIITQPSGTTFNNNTYGANITEVDPIYTAEKPSYLPFWINWTLISDNLFAPINSIDNSSWFSYTFERYNITREPTGFSEQGVFSSQLMFTDATRNFTINGTYDFYCKGAKFTKSNTDSVIIPVTAGITNYIYFDCAGDLQQSVQPWNNDFLNVVMVATVFWNGTAGVVGKERHGLTMDVATHQYLHYTVGTRYISGLTGTFTTPSNWSIGAGSIADEDNIDNNLAQNTTRVFYHQSDTKYTFTPVQTNFTVKVANILQYDNLTALADVPTAGYVAYWFVESVDRDTPTYVIMGQRTDTTLANAQANNKWESMVLSGLDLPEYKLLYRVILKRQGTSTSTIEDVQDLRSVSNLPSGTYVATEHGSLTGLLDDDHTQYVLADGTRNVTGSSVGSSGTTTSPIQNNGYVQINSSGSQISNNETTFINENGTAFGKRVQNGTNGFQIVLPPTFIASGQINYINTENIARCTAGQDCQFTKDFSAGDRVSCNAGVNKARVKNVLNNTYITLADNNLGYCSGTGLTLTVYKTFWIDLATGKSATTGKGAFGIDDDGGENHGGSIGIPNGYTFYANGNVYIDSVGGSTYLYANSNEVMRLVSGTGASIASGLAFIFGSDGTGGAGGGTKAEGLIRGGKNGGSTNGGGHPLAFEVSALGSNSVMYMDWRVGQPTTSGVTQQVDSTLMRLTYNKLRLNTTINMTGLEGQFNDIVGVNNLKFKGSNATITSDGANIIFNISGGYSVQAINQSGGWANFEGNAFITHTDIYDSSKTGKTALSQIKSTSELLTSTGKINHTAFGYSYVKTPIVATIGYDVKTWKEKKCDYENSTGEWLETNCTIENKVYNIPITNITGYNDGVDNIKETALLKKQIEELATELCRVEKAKYNFCGSDGKVLK